MVSLLQQRGEMSDQSNQSTTFVPDDDGLSVTATGQMTVGIVVLIIVLTIVILVLYLRSKGYSGAIVSSRRTRRLVFAPNEPTLPRNALDRSILESLPVTVYRSADHSEDLECAVCLCELIDGEEARFLPKCNHAFHVGCIDMWFHSNSTCPLCRVPVQYYSATNDEVAVAVEIPVRPSQEQGSSSSCSSSGKRELVIEIPRRGVMGGFLTPRSALPSSKRSVERVKSPALEKLRSLQRMMSRGRGKEVSTSSCTPRPAFDIEQGGIRDLKLQ